MSFHLTISYFTVIAGYNYALFYMWKRYPNEIKECTGSGQNGGEDIQEMPPTVTGGNEFNMRECAAYERPIVMLEACAGEGGDYVISSKITVDKRAVIILGTDRQKRRELLPVMIRGRQHDLLFATIPYQQGYDTPRKVCCVHQEAGQRTYNYIL